MTSRLSLPVPSPTPWVFDVNRDPPVYTRPLVGSELLMHRMSATLDGQVIFCPLARKRSPTLCDVCCGALSSDRVCETCFGINFTSSLKAGELENRAREAVDKLRFVCPIIACDVEDAIAPRWVYTPSADREAWLNLAFGVVERGPSLNPDEFIQLMNLKRLPYTNGNGTTIFLKTYLLTTSKESDDGSREYGLYFHGSHSIIDAGPAFHALNLICEWICGEGMAVRMEGSEEWKNLPVDPIAAIGAPSKELWETAGTRLMLELAEQSVRTAPLHTLPSLTRPVNDSLPPFHYTITASETETAAIIASETKKLGISVSALFHAAFCLAQIKMNPIPEGAEFDFPSESTAVSLERYMKPPVDPRTHFISLFTTMSLRFSLSQVLMERSEKTTLVADSTLTQRAANTKPDQEGVPTTGWAIFNNLGVVEKRLRTQHGKLSIDSICGGSRLRQAMLVHVWTIHSRLHFRVQGDTVWEEESIKMLVEETRRIGFLALDDVNHVNA